MRLLLKSFLAQATSVWCLILTDSGGIQEETPSLGIPVLVLRDTTERPEGVEAGTLKLAGIDEKTIFNLANELLSNVDSHYFSYYNHRFFNGFLHGRIQVSV